MKALSKKIVFILLLTFVFIFDDVLVYFLFKNIYNWKINPLLFGIGVTIVTGLNVSLAVLVFRIMRKKPTTGQQGMIGKVGVVLKMVKGEGQVQVSGEIWNAESAEQIKVGEKVVVEKVEGLKLFVKKTDYPKRVS